MSDMLSKEHYCYKIYKSIINKKQCLPAGPPPPTPPLRKKKWGSPPPPPPTNFYKKILILPFYDFSKIPTPYK